MALLAATTIPAHATLPPSDELNLADVADREGRPEEAMVWRRKAVEREPHDPMAQIRLGDALRTGGRPAEAIEHYEAVLSRRDLAADWINAATRSVARCHFALGQYDLAVEWFRKFLAASPDAPWTDGRPDFHLHGAPPLQSCLIRLDLSLSLERAGRKAEAAAEAGRVLTDCVESEELVDRAQKRLQELAEASPAPAR